MDHAHGNIDVIYITGGLQWYTAHANMDVIYPTGVFNGSLHMVIWM